MISNTRGTFEPKTHARSHLKPLKILQKCDLGGPDICKKLFLPIFVNRGIKPLGKIFKFPETDIKKKTFFFSGIQFPHFNSEPVDGLSKMPQINGAKPQGYTVEYCFMVREPFKYYLADFVP